MKLTKILVLAAQLRVLVIMLQCVANYFMPDHEANVFEYPRTETDRTMWDDLVYALCNGLIKWDGQYFMHIALYGYTYENTLAFFPLLPLTVRYLAKLTHLPFLCFESQVLLTFVIFNFIMFLVAAIILYKLTEEWFDKHKAALTVLLFLFNPASIFFSAAYTECLFAALTFASIYSCSKLNFNTFFVSANWLLVCCVTISLSTLTRANGLLNLGFLGYFFMRNLRTSVLFYEDVNILIKLTKISCNLILLGFTFIICTAPFVLLQFHHYSNYCFEDTFDLPLVVTNHAAKFHYRLMGQYYGQPWCDFSLLPLPYAYVQDFYWNVGFFRYYELKQLPNFFLATPIIYITLSETLRFLYYNHDYLVHLGIFKVLYHCFFRRINVFGKKTKIMRKEEKEKDRLFVCVIHALLLCIFCIFFVHIQVTTRMLFSATPAAYWFCLNKNKTFIKLYFFTYYFVGIVMFSNFLPWT